MRHTHFLSLEDWHSRKESRKVKCAPGSGLRSIGQMMTLRRSRGPLPRKKNMLQTDKRWKEHWTVSGTRKPSQKRSDVASGYPGPGINGGATRDLYAKPHMTLEPTDFISLCTLHIAQSFKTFSYAFNLKIHVLLWKTERCSLPSFPSC